MLRWDFVVVWCGYIFHIFRLNLMNSQLEDFKSSYHNRNLFWMIDNFKEDREGCENIISHRFQISTGFVWRETGIDIRTFHSPSSSFISLLLGVPSSYLTSPNWLEKGWVRPCIDPGFFSMARKECRPGLLFPRIRVGLIPLTQQRTMVRRCRCPVGWIWCWLGWIIDAGHRQALTPLRRKERGGNMIYWWMWG